MKLIFKKEFNGDVEKLPSREVEGAVVFKEPESIQKLSIIGNTLGIIIIIAAIIPIMLNIGWRGILDSNWNILLGALFSVLVIPLHEILHAICFRETVEFHTYLKKGLCFVVGTESMTKARFVLMCLLPNIVFGVIPYALFFIFPDQVWLGIFGLLGLGAGAGDYINVFNALTQMPKGSLCFMSKNRSYWYIPKK